MELLGDANWWLPKWLDRTLPPLDVEGHALAAATSEDEDDPSDLVGVGAFPDMPAERTFGGGERNHRAAFRAVLRRSFIARLTAVQIDVLFQRPMQQSRGAEIQHDAVGLDDARMLLG